MKKLGYHLRFFSEFGMNGLTQPAFTYSKLTVRTLEQSVKFVQS